MAGAQPRVRNGRTSDFEKDLDENHANAAISLDPGGRNRQVINCKLRSVENAHYDARLFRAPVQKQSI